MTIQDLIDTLKTYPKDMEVQVLGYGGCEYCFGPDYCEGWLEGYKKGVGTVTIMTGPYGTDGERDENCAGLVKFEDALKARSL